MAIDRRKFLGDAGALGLAAMTVPGTLQAQTSETKSTTTTSTTNRVNAMANPFSEVSTLTEPKLEFVFEIDLDFTRVQNINNMPTGGGRGAVYLDAGRIRGPKLNGQAVPNSGGDWAFFRPDDVLSFDARYMLEEDDGTLILLHNKGYLWGREPDTMDKIRAWIFDGGPVIPPEEYYLRAFPTFEVETGKHDWLMRHVFVGIGERKEAGNTLRYYALL